MIKYKTGPVQKQNPIFRDSPSSCLEGKIFLIFSLSHSYGQEVIDTKREH